MVKFAAGAEVAPRNIIPAAGDGRYTLIQTIERQIGDGEFVGYFVYLCGDCGGLVADTYLHDSWHRRTDA